MSDTHLAIPSLPKDEFYEDYVAAVLSKGVLFLERRQNVLSELSGVPKDEVVYGLQAFDLQFPLDNDSWFIDKSNTSIKILQFMPLPFSGVGANFRRLYYRIDDDHYDYKDLEGKLSGIYTVNDLIKFNNLAVEYLSKAKELVVRQ